MNLEDSEVLKTYPLFIDPEGSLTCPWNTTISTYPEPNELPLYMTIRFVVTA